MSYLSSIVEKGEICFSGLGDREVAFGGCLDVDAVLFRAYVERSAGAGIVDVLLMADAHEVVVGATIVDVAAEGHFPDSVIVFAGVGELLFDFRGHATSKCENGLQNLWE